MTLTVQDIGKRLDEATRLLVQVRDGLAGSGHQWLLDKVSGALAILESKPSEPVESIVFRADDGSLCKFWFKRDADGRFRPQVDPA